MISWHEGPYGREDGSDSCGEDTVESWLRMVAARASSRIGGLGGHTHPCRALAGNLSETAALMPSMASHGIGYSPPGCTHFVWHLSAPRKYVASIGGNSTEPSILLFQILGV